jgi:hypothetical protein
VTSYRVHYPCGKRLVFPSEKDARKSGLAIGRAKQCCAKGHDLFRVYELNADGKEIQPAVFIEYSLKHLCWAEDHPECNGLGPCKHPTWRAYMVEAPDNWRPVHVSFAPRIHRTFEETQAESQARIPTSPNVDGKVVRWTLRDAFAPKRREYTARFGLKYPENESEWQAYAAAKHDLGALVHEAFQSEKDHE